MWREYHFSHAFQTQVSHAKLSLELCITIASALVLNIQRLFLRETVHLVSREPQINEGLLIALQEVSFRQLTLLKLRRI